MEYDDPLDGISLASQFDQLEVADVPYVCVIDDGEWWVEMHKALPSGWETNEIEPVDPWGTQEEEVGHLT